MSTISLSRVEIGGVPIALARPAEAAEVIVDRALQGSSSGTHVHLVNAYTIALASKTEAYRVHLGEANSVCFPDGKPLTWVGRMRGARLEQVRGPRFFTDVVDRGRERGVKHFLLGASDQTLKLLESELIRKYPGVQIVGAYSPPFRPLTEGERAEQDRLIRTSGAHVVWVGLGTPKQDYESTRLASQLPIVAAAVGAAFDFAAGTRAEAPEWVSKIGMEWFFRLATEPRRLWRRYLIGNFQFVVAVLRRRPGALNE